MLRMHKEVADRFLRYERKEGDGRRGKKGGKVKLAR
jgi:hypothetical protein